MQFLVSFFHHAIQAVDRVVISFYLFEAVQITKASHLQLYIYIYVFSMFDDLVAASEFSSSSIRVKAADAPTFDTSDMHPPRIPELIPHGH